MGGEGFLDRANFPEKLTARVVDAPSRPHLHGYDVEGDVCLNYSFGEAILLALTGTPPNRRAGRAFEAAMTLWLPAFIGEGPAHAAALAQVCAARTSGVVAAGAITLAEQSRWVVEEHRDLLNWLEGPEAPFPERHRASAPEDGEAVAHLETAVGEFANEVMAFSQRPTRTAAVVSTLFAAGLRQPEQVEAALTLARLPGVVAEGLATPKGKLKEYPMNLPHFEYCGGR